MIGNNDFLEPLADTIFAPSMLRQKLLQRPGSDIGVQCDRLDALLGQVRQLAPNVHSQVRTRVLATEAVAEPIEKLKQLRLQLVNLIDIHALPPRSPWQGTASQLIGFSARGS
jgi:hypothetical protein